MLASPHFATANSVLSGVNVMRAKCMLSFSSVSCECKNICALENFFVAVKYTARGQRSPTHAAISAQLCDVAIAGGSCACTCKCMCACDLSACAKCVRARSLSASLH
jgi:hypothetical protein